MSDEEGAICRRIDLAHSEAAHDFWAENYWKDVTALRVELAAISVSAKERPSLQGIIERAREAKALIICPCGATLHNNMDTGQHWGIGHFDVPRNAAILRAEKAAADRETLAVQVEKLRMAINKALTYLNAYVEVKELDTSKRLGLIAFTLAQGLGDLPATRQE